MRCTDANQVLKITKEEKIYDQRMVSKPKIPTTKHLLQLHGITTIMIDGGLIQIVQNLVA